MTPLPRRAGAIAGFAAAVGSLSLGASDARAQPEPPEGSATEAQSDADALFVEGKWLMGAGEYPRACAKFAESERLDPAAGTLLNLADCYEKNGQLASAWVTFREATTAAERNGRAAWASQAAARARLLEPRLPTLTIEIDPARAQDGIEVSRDGAPIERSAWGSAVAVDPSTSRIEVRAPNKKVWTTTVTVDPEHPHVSVVVPPLEDLRGPAGDAVQGAPRRPAQKPAALALLAGAGVSAGIGAVFGVMAITKNADAARRCPPSPCTDPVAVTLTTDAHHAATGSDVAFTASGALLVAGALLFFTAPSSTAGATVRPGVSFGGGGWAASLVGRF